jgi:Xaa-Pro aminopeptidase
MRFMKLKQQFLSKRTLGVALWLCLSASVGTTQTINESIIRVTPPSPVIDPAERVAELTERRASVAKAIGQKALLILFGAEVRLYTGNVSYEYRQENNLYYLTNLNQPQATLVLAPGGSQYREVLFMPQRSRAREVWDGHMYRAEEASSISGIKEIWSERELPFFLEALKKRRPYKPKPENILLTAATASTAEQAGPFDYLFPFAEKKEAEIYALLPARESHEYRGEQRLAADPDMKTAGYIFKSALPIFAGSRIKKSPLELRLLQHAIDITIEAQQRAWLAAETAKWEYEIDALILHTFRRRNADNWGFPSIVGAGPNANTVHYGGSQGPIRTGWLLLMDIGAEYGHYTADVTRTIPVNGKFTPAQAEIYQAVFDAQEAGFKVVKPGALVSDAQRAATASAKDSLLKLGLITNRDDDSYLIWFLHGVSHWLGMNVHDVGDFGRRLESGMVFTIEPGIYVREDALDYKPTRWSNEDWEKFKAAVRPAFEKYKNIGVRIEDDVVVTPTGARWMTEALPRKISEIEDFIEKGRK